MGASPSLLSANVETFNKSGGAPSFGCMIGDRGNSETGSSCFSDDAPPSFTDVVRRDASESSFDQNLHEVNFEETSSRGINFGEISPDHELPLPESFESKINFRDDEVKADEDLESAAADHQYSSSPTRQVRGSFKNWQKGDVLGSGSFGTVYEGFTEHGDFFAVKEVSLLDQDSQGRQSFAQLEQGFSLHKWSGKNCYKLAARDLSIAWGDTPCYWRWISVPDSRFPEVAELVDVCWLEVRGRISSAMLSADTCYVAYLVYKSALGAYGFEYQRVKVSIGISGGKKKNKTVFLDHEAWQRQSYECGLPGEEVFRRQPPRGTGRNGGKMGGWRLNWESI